MSTENKGRFYQDFPRPMAYSQIFCEFAKSFIFTLHSGFFWEKLNCILIAWPNLANSFVFFSFFCRTFLSFCICHPHVFRCHVCSSLYCLKLSTLILSFSKPRMHRWDELCIANILLKYSIDYFSLHCFFHLLAKNISFWIFHVSTSI